MTSYNEMVILYNTSLKIYLYNEPLDILFATNGQVDITFFVQCFHDNPLFQHEGLTFLASIMIST